MNIYTNVHNAGNSLLHDSQIKQEDEYSHYHGHGNSLWHSVQTHDGHTLVNEQFHRGGHYQNGTIAQNGFHDFSTTPVFTSAIGSVSTCYTNAPTSTLAVETMSSVAPIHAASPAVHTDLSGCDSASNRSKSNFSCTSSNESSSLGELEINEIEEMEEGEEQDENQNHSGEKKQKPVSLKTYPFQIKQHIIKFKL